MQNLQEYIRKRQDYIDKIQNEIDALTSSGLEIKVTHDRWDKQEFVINDYTKANHFELVRSCGCCSDSPYFLHFIYQLETKNGNIKLYTRHDNWNGDNLRFGFEFDIGGYSIKDDSRLDKLIDFYSNKGVSPEILVNVRKEINDLIELKSYDEESSEDVEV